MREIKFRGKVDGVWWYVTPDQFIRWKHFWADVDRKTVGQYINLKDKHGNEVYEEDIIKCYNGIVNQYFNSVVTWEITEIQDDISDFPLKVAGFIIGSLSEVEIIGNIYDNPELLK